MGRLRRFLLPSLLAGCVGAAASMALAQHGGSHGGSLPGGERGSGGGGMAGGLGNRGFSPGTYGPGNYGHMNSGSLPGSAPDSAGTASGARGGLQLGPPGRWWDDRHFAKDLNLRPDQQRRMDAIFEANRASLMKRLSDTQQEESRLEALTRSRSLAEGALSAQIDRVYAARAELEKAKTHYLLQLRGEMDADQLAHLEERR